MAKKCMNTGIDSVCALENSQAQYPLRMIVHKNLIGIVMGRSQSRAKQISKTTKTRIFYDDTREENENVSDITLAIYGKPENCSKACCNILLLMEYRLRKLGHPGDVALKIIIPRCYMGRIFGREYNVLRTFGSTTKTLIITSDKYVKTMVDRVIKIYGSIENVCKAEVEISKYLRRSFTNDLHTKAPQYTIYPSVPEENTNYAGNNFQNSHLVFLPVQYHPPCLSDTYEYSSLYSIVAYQYPALIIQPQTITNMECNQPQFSPEQCLPSTSNFTDPFLTTNDYNAQTDETIINPELDDMMEQPNVEYSAPVFQNTDQPLSSACCSYVTNPSLASNVYDPQDYVHVFIPDISVKSLVGIAGCNINEISKISGARLRILPLKVENPIAASKFCHKVIVIGTYRAQWKAQEMIFETMWKDGYGPAPEDVILTTEIAVPHNQVSYMIDHHKSIAWEIEKEMKCLIRLPTNQTSDNPGYMTLHIIGGFIGTQLAQKKIRSILYNQI